MGLRCFALAIWMSGSAAAQKYAGPPPATADLLFIQHAQTLVPTERVQAKENKIKDDTVYTIDGLNSPARTPLALPMFIVKTDQLAPERLILYRLKTVENHREIALSAKRLNADPIHVDVIQTGDHLYKLTVYDGLDPGEYALSPVDSNLMFCFQVY